MGAFGDKLRKQREARGISLEAISKTTKISVRMLQAIEEESFEQLPGGVFNKGFVRAYARQVGLSEEEAVSDYLTALREGQINAQAILPNFRQERPFRVPDAPPVPVAPPVRPQPNVATIQQSLAEGLAGLFGVDPVKSSADATLNDDKTNASTQRIEDLIHHHELLAEPEIDKPDHSERRTANRRAEERRRNDRQNNNHFPTDISATGNGHHPAATSERVGREVVTPVSFASDPDATKRIPWEKLAVGFSFVILALVIWNIHRRNQAVPVAVVQGVPAPPAPSVAGPVQAAPQPAGSKAGNGKKLSATAAYRAAVAATQSSSVSPKVSAKKNTPAKSPSRSFAKSQPPTPVRKVTRGTNKSAKLLTPARFSLLIRAKENTWVAISADGQPVARETLIAPAHTSVRASREIVVKTGNAAAVSFSLNGVEFPAQGASGEKRTYTFGPSGLKNSRVDIAGR